MGEDVGCDEAQLNDILENGKVEIHYITSHFNSNNYSGKIFDSKADFYGEQIDLDDRNALIRTVRANDVYLWDNIWDLGFQLKS